MNTTECLRFKTRALNYAVFGTILGLLFPILGCTLALWERSIPFRADTFLGLQASSPMMWILDTVPLFLGIVFHIAGRNEDSFLNIQFNLSRLASQKTAEAQHAHQLEILLNSLLSTAIKDLSLKEQLQQSLEIVLSCPSLTISQKGGIFLADEHRPESLRLAVYKNVDAATLNTFQGCTREDHANQPERPTSDELYHVPIMLGKETLGMIVLFTETGHVQTAREARFLEAVANTLAGIIHRDRLERHIYLQRLTLESTEV